MKRLLAGLGSLIALVVLLVGIPAVLILVAGNPVPSGDALQAWATRQDFAGTFLLGSVLPIIAWIAWGTFAVSVLTVIPSTLRGIHPPRLPGLGFQQRTAAALLGTILIMFTGFTGATAATAAPMDTSTSYSASQDAAASTTIADTSAVDDSASSSTEELPQYEVKSGDTLWTIAQAELGDGKRYTEIAQLNYDVTQEDGGKLTPDNHWVASGWILELPADAGAHVDAAAPAPAAPVVAAASTTANNTTTAAETPAPAAETPAPAAEAPAPATTEDEQRTIQPGDTLWDIAEQEYGSGDRYPEIFDASSSVVQADGQQISDPNMILPGWEVTVPDVSVAAPAAPAPAAPAPAAPTAPTGSESAGSGADAAADAGTSADTGAEATGIDAGTGAGATGTAAEEGTNSSDETQQAEQPTSTEDEDDALAGIFASPTMTIGGIGSLLAAGILSLLGIRRFQQRRNRKPGQRISMPDLQTATTELELRAVEDPQGVDDIDRSLRFLASWARDTDAQLPKLFALRLSGETVELYLDESADLPAPFVLASDDRMAWSVKPDEIPEFNPRPTAPYPGLVTLGQDPANGHILVDLEQIGSLNIQGPDDETTEGALTALAIELACSKWADDLQVTVVGFAPELAAAFNTGRVQYVDDVRSLMSSLRGRARAYTKAFGDLHVDGPQQARTTAETDTWTPEIVLLRHLPDEKTQAELVELIEHTPRVGIAAITHGQLTGNWSLNIAADRSATLNPAGISITAQVVAGEEYQHILDSLDVASREAVTPTIEVEIPAAADEPLEVDPDDVEVTVERVPATTTTAATGWDFDLTEDDVNAPESATEIPTPAMDVDEPASAAAVVDELAVGELVSEAETPATEISTEGASEPAPVLEEPLELPAPVAPVIRVLGQIHIDGAVGPEPRTAKTTYVAPATELLVFLAMNPGATGDQVSEALWPGKATTATSNRNQLMSRARRWLGKSATDEDYLPYVTTSSYELHDDVTSDWGIWKTLIGDNLENTPTRNLVAAMKLVDGQPFDGAPRRRYAWADSYRQEMIASIVDAAHELAERSLSIRDVATARLAAIVGEKADPASEIPVRDRLRAEDLANDVDGIERTIARLDLHLAELDEDEPEEETQRLIDELRNHRIAS